LILLGAVVDEAQVEAGFALLKPAIDKRVKKDKAKRPSKRNWCLCA